MKPLELMDLDAVMTTMRQRLSDYEFETQTLPLALALGRKAAENKWAHFPVPGFKRSGVDGFAVLLSDLNQGSCTLSLKGRVEMGTPIGRALRTGETIYVPTGGMIPEGAEAVVMQEYATIEGGLSEGLARYSGKTTPDEVLVTLNTKDTPMGENIVSAEEDFSEGTQLVKVGTRLKAAHLGKLAAAGYPSIQVYCRPKVWILSTGNELIQPSQTQPVKPDAGKVYNLNGVTLEGLASNMGFEVVGNSWCEDDEMVLYHTMVKALETADMVILSGGSSVGEKDVTARAVKRFDHAEILIHGIRIKPGKPTLLAQVGLKRKLVLGLPGHPASAYMIMACFGGYLAEHVWQSKAPTYPISARLTHDLKAAVGRDQLVLVSLSQENAEDDHGVPSLLQKEAALASVLSGKSAAISKISEAQGYFLQRVEDGPLKKGDLLTIVEL